jgi:hypothetical protein
LACRDDLRTVAVVLELGEGGVVELRIADDPTSRIDEGDAYA